MLVAMGPLPDVAVYTDDRLLLPDGRCSCNMKCSRHLFKHARARAPGGLSLHVHSLIAFKAFQFRQSSETLPP